MRLQSKDRFKSLTIVVLVRVFKILVKLFREFHHVLRQVKEESLEIDFFINYVNIHF